MADTLAPPRLLTAEEFLDLCADGRRAELIDGEEVAMPPAGDEHSDVALAITAELRAYARRRRAGRAFESSVGVLLSRNPDTVREPDGALVLGDVALTGGFLTVVPELILEVVSPHDRAAQVQSKVDSWLAAGARVVWVAYPSLGRLAVHRADGAVRFLSRGDTLTCDDLLPGFTLPLAEVFGDVDG